MATHPHHCTHYINANFVPGYNSKREFIMTGFLVALGGVCLQKKSHA